MKWWHEARFGMFIHWASTACWGPRVGDGKRGHPRGEYEQLAKRFKPKPNAGSDWARLASRRQKYMVMTTKHHEGFCQFATKLTDYCAPKQGPGRDLVKEYVEAARAEGLRVGFYHSLMDWHHPDGARCAPTKPPAAVSSINVHGQIRELLTNYGRSTCCGMTWLAARRQGLGVGEDERDGVPTPAEIIVNNATSWMRFRDAGAEIQAEAKRAWESCMTMNDSWGYHTTDDDWKRPRPLCATW